LSKMKLKVLLFLAVNLIWFSHVSEAQAMESQTNIRPCTNSVFLFQTNFWVNLHLFLRAESRRRSVNAPLQMPVTSLSTDEQAAWKAGLDAYDGMAKLSLISDDGLVRLINTLAEVGDATVLPSNGIEPRIANALNRAAPVYRAHLWPEHRQQDEEWIAAHCSDIQRFDRHVKKTTSKDLVVTPPREPILVDLALETGPTLAYTTGGPVGTAGHTIISPEKNSDPELALNTIFHEISHTMDNKIPEVIDKEAARQRVKPPENLWHAVTLYTTCEITKGALAKDGRPTTSLDTDRAKMFARNGWQVILAALEKDWQPYLDKKTSFNFALGNLVRDTSKLEVRDWVVFCRKN
jgi:hypothetical protein